MKKKVVIVGTGPAGIGAAYTLAEEKDLEIILIDQGKKIEERGTSSFGKSYGFGGVGAYSDGKFIFETLSGKRQIGTNLDELEVDAKEYLRKAKENIFFPNYQNAFGKLPPEISEERISKSRQIAMVASKNGMDYIVARDYHIGTDLLPKLISTIQNDLESKGVKIISGKRVQNFDTTKVYARDTGKKGNFDSEYEFDYLVIAPGRDGSKWLENLLNEKKIEHKSRPIDIGVRIEVDSKIIQHLTDVERDVKFEFRHPNGDLIRTFCVCPYGQVVKERKKPEFAGADYNLVNGASNSCALSENTNFALLVRMPLNQNGNNADYGIKTGQLFSVAGIDRPVLQRYAELKQGRRSKEEKQNEWRVKPSMDGGYLVGDLRIGMPSRIMDDLRYGIDRLSATGLIEGLNGDDTLIYGPEIKMHGIEISTTNFLESISMPNIFFAGDGTGFSRGIGGAMASGILAGEGILKKVKNL